MDFVDWVQTFDQLRHGWAGAAVLVASWLVSNAAVFLGAKRFYAARPTTHALLGGEGRFAVQGPRDVDELFCAVDRCDARLSQSAGDPAKAARIAERMMGECRELYRLNIAFRTQNDRIGYLDRIEERWGKAERAMKMARSAVREVA